VVLEIDDLLVGSSTNRVRRSFLEAREISLDSFRPCTVDSANEGPSSVWPWVGDLREDRLDGNAVVVGGGEGAGGKRSTVDMYLDGDGEADELTGERPAIVLLRRSDLRLWDCEATSRYTFRRPLKPSVTSNGSAVV
jgi:hypothetical protein